MKVPTFEPELSQYFDTHKNLTDFIMGRDIVGGIATRYRPEDSGFEHHWVHKLSSVPHPSRKDPVPTLPSVQWVPRVFPGG